MNPRLQRLQRLEGAARPYCLHTRRYVHSSRPKNSSAFPTHPADIGHHSVATTSQASPLACLPLSTVLRTYLITTVSSSPPLLNVCLVILNRMVNSKSALMDLERNKALSWVLKKTFYAQFCAGENRKEVQRTMKQVKELGYNGMILEYALEVLGGQEGATADSKATAEEIESWRVGMLESVQLTNAGDFIAVKWSGLGNYAFQLLRQGRSPTPEMERAILDVCDLAKAKGVSILCDAEEIATNVGIDRWTIELQRRYNKHQPGRATIFNTYQAYLKDTPNKLAQHLADARKEGYTLGAKLVRGAYLASEPRHFIWDTKSETDQTYDRIAEALLERRYNSVLKPIDGAAVFPQVDMVLATHNQESVRKAQALRSKQAARGEKRIRLAYAQLQGMADEVSCELVQAGNPHESVKGNIDIPRAYKCVTWGTTGQCLHFLLRRASENKDAASRTQDSRKAMGLELWRRLKGAFRLA